MVGNASKVMPEVASVVAALLELEYFVVTKRLLVGGLANSGRTLASGLGAPAGALSEVVSVTVVPAGALLGAATHVPEKPPKAGIGSGVPATRGTVVEVDSGLGDGDGLGPPHV